MNFMKRAIIYLVRKKGRAMIMMLFLFLMSCSVLIGISFIKSTESEMDRLRQSLASGFILKVNTQNEMYREYVEYEDGLGRYDYTGPKITEEMIEKILSLDGVKDYIIDTVHVAWTNLELRPGLHTDYLANVEELKAMADPPTEEELIYGCHQIDLYPCRNGKMHKNFQSGALTIVEGRNIEQEDHFKAVISDWLAENNYLSVGDTITFETKEGGYVFSDSPMKNIGVPVEVEIAGLFHAVVSLPYSESTLESSYIENVVYIDMDTYEKLQENLDVPGYEGTRVEGYIEVEFVVEDPGKLESVMHQIENGEGLDLENMEFEVDDTAYQATEKPYRQIRIFAILLLALGLCGIGIILYLVLKFWVQGRKHEIGILYSIGMKKSEVLGQMLMECLFVSAIALVLAIALSGPLINTCADAAERLTMPKADAEEFHISLNEAFEPVMTKTLSDKAILEHTVSGNTILFMVLFVCGVSIASVILSFVSISHVEPKKLLQ